MEEINYTRYVCTFVVCNKKQKTKKITKKTKKIYLMFGNFIVEKLVQKGDDMLNQMNDLYADFPRE